MPPNPEDPTRDKQRSRLHYLPFDSVEAGMTLGEPIHLAEHHILRFSLPAGHTLTEDNLQQLAAHHAEFVCIATEDTRSEAQIAADKAAALANVQRIFAGADLSQPVLAALFERVLDYRSQ